MGVQGEVCCAVQHNICLVLQHLPVLLAQPQAGRLQVALNDAHSAEGVATGCVALSLLVQQVEQGPGEHLLDTLDGRQLALPTHQQQHALDLWGWGSAEHERQWATGAASRRYKWAIRAMSHGPKTLQSSHPYTKAS